MQEAAGLTENKKHVRCRTRLELVPCWIVRGAMMIKICKIVSVFGSILCIAGCIMGFFDM